MASSNFYRLGVDVGGTNTDAVILDVRDASGPNRGVIAFHKTPTTAPNVTDGIEAAVKSVLDQSKIPPSQIACLTIGTTHFINAIVEHDARRLAPVAIIRLSKSFTREVPPFSDFPPALTKIMNGHYGYVDGGLHIDGSQEAPISEEQVVKQCALIREKGIEAVVICGVFSPIDDHFHQEKAVRDIVLREIPGADVVISSDVSQIGFLERENAAILNASILKFARRTVRGFRAAMKRLNLTCALYLTQNDGTLIDAPSAARLPIRTFSSGPTNSMRGASYLGEMRGERTSTIVVDIGGTTSDVGVLLPSGFPRQASAYVTVAGVKINFGMPHLESIGLGGGSIVRVNGDKVTVGPDSVGHFLDSKATVFGGDTLTATDIAVRAGENIGNAELVGHLSDTTVSLAQARVKLMLERVIDMMKTSPAPLPVLLVGGGSVVAPTELDGVSSVVCPPFHSVANAVGAAIAKVGGAVDFIQSSTNKAVSEIVEEAKVLAIERAVAAGASRETVFVAEVDAIPLQYVNNNEVRVIVRAVGELSPDGVPTTNGTAGTTEDENEDDGETYQEAEKDRSARTDTESPAVDINSYVPTVMKNPETGVDEWEISELDLEWLADGCYVLGCAGGGTPFSEFLRLRDQIRAGFRMRVIDASSLAEDANVYCKLMVGAAN
jgi:N-methylhydantoinase A/oxoprolinase/acetone carboxylase beta subunit